MTSIVGDFSGDSSVRIVLRALWVARVPVATIVAAIVIFSQAEALDLFVDIPPSYVARFFHWALFYLVAIIFWVLPAHFSARLALQLNCERIGVDTPRRYTLLVIWLPRALSVLCFVVILYAFLQAWRHVPSVDKNNLGLANVATEHLQWAAVWALALCPGVLLFYWALARLPILRRGRLRLVGPRLYDQLDRALVWAKPRRRRVREPLFDEQVAAAQHNTLVSVLLLLTITFALDVLLAVLFLSPTVADWFPTLVPTLESYVPRAVFVPVLLGINVPGLTLLGVLSHRFRFPMILFFFLGLGTWGAFWESRHNVRIVTQKDPTPRMSLERAVRHWKQVNCQPSQLECPRPIIVAASGGASRAAFMAANALAYLQETFPNFSEQLFAISSVSGGSLGAAAFLAGLDRQGLPADAAAHKSVCGDRRFQGWFACHREAVQAHQELDQKLLQKRVQLFLSNDFLTPVFVTFAFSDMWRIGPDRAVKLEKGWERAWREVTDDKADKDGDFGRLFSSFLPNDPGKWRPLLLLNSTSVGTGRRVIISPLAPTHNGRRLFVDAYDFYEMACPAPEGKCNLRLSTAVALSARFPLVSPAGGIAREDEILDRLVDGGYFENFGAQTALELARELGKEPFNLKPFILQITNDPSAFDHDQCRQKINWDEQFRQRQPDLPPANVNANLLRWASDPVDTVLATRTARGTHATSEALQTVGAGNYAQIRVCPQRLEPTNAEGRLAKAKQQLLSWLRSYGLARERRDAKSADAFKALSASWWLSTPVQQYLHHQLEKDYNCAEIERVGSVLRAGPRATPRC